MVGWKGRRRAYIASKIQEAATTSCYVYAVDLSSGNKTSVSKIKESWGHLKKFLERHKDSDPDFVMSQRGCRNGFKNMYEENGKWVYSLDLQKKNWLNENGIEKIIVEK